jgi:NADH-quinone oxidoreductase subunit L
MGWLEHVLMTAPADTAAVASSLWMIIALPLLGAAICGIFGRALGRANTNFIACTAVAGSFLLSLIALWTTSEPTTRALFPFSLNPTSYALNHNFGTWFAAGAFRANFGLTVDHLSATMLLVITGVGLLIHIYSTEYMGHDPGFWRYFAYLNLFIAMMLTLVLADNLTLLFIGWEGVGLCSYLLIGFWYDDAAKAWAGRKAFVTNRIGDFGFLIGAFVLVLWVEAWNNQIGSALHSRASEVWRSGLSVAGPLNLSGLEELTKLIASPQSQVTTLKTVIAAGPLAGFTFGGVMTAALLLLMLGAAGKSAQLPLYVWLPDAMAGPTPVSALIHAATMVTAGVYLFCRLNFLLVLSPLAMTCVAVIGALTALFAALIAFAQNDIKKVLAYSTISQLGFMFMGVGMGIFWAAILHLVTHAFFKACLFLGAGSVMHGNGDETNIKRLGGLRRAMPWTWLTFLIATLAITGIVPLSGFFSKDAILDGVHSTQLYGFPWASGLVWTLGLASAFCTAFYMVRLYLLTFEGERSPDAQVKHPHESRWPMTLPLMVLAALSILGALYGLPLLHVDGEVQTPLQNYLSPIFALAERLAPSYSLAGLRHEGNPAAFWALAWVIALAGGGTAAYLYLKQFPRWGTKPVPALARTLRRWAENKFYVDEFYELVIIKPVNFASMVLYRVVDELLIDTLAVRGSAWLTARIGDALRYLQTGNAQSYAAVMAVALAGAVAYAVFQVLRP